MTDQNATAEREHADPPTPDPAAARRAAAIAELRQVAAGYLLLADAMEARPAIPEPYGADRPLMLCVASAQALAAAARALPCDLAKEAAEKWLNLNGKIAGLHVQLYGTRDKVCTITGYEEVEVEVEITPAVTAKVTRPVPVWECAPVLAAQPAEAAS